MRHALVLATALVLGCGEPGLELATNRSAIIDGTAASHPHVGYLWTARGSLCTATLIRESHVLTAAHCVAPIGGQVTPGNLTFYLDGVDYPTHSSSVEVHPNYAMNVDFNKDAVDAWVRGDLAVIAFEQVIEEGHSVPLGAAPPVGDEVSQWGFGVDDSGGYGTSHRGTTQVREVYASFFLTIADQPGYGMVQPGDSGGPSFDDQGRLVGVHSFIRTLGELYSYDEGTPKVATGREALDTRVDTAVQWVDQVVNAYYGGAGEPDGAEEPTEPEEPEPICPEGEQCEGKGDRPGTLPPTADGCSVGAAPASPLALLGLLVLAALRRRS